MYKHIYIYIYTLSKLHILFCSLSINIQTYKLRFTEWLILFILVYIDIYTSCSDIHILR